MQPKKISVIIPTRGRDACLRQTIRDLSIQTFKDFDLWIIDQNTYPLLHLEEDAQDITMFHQSMPPLGSHAGRNHAIFQTTAEICVFVDDDVRFNKNFLAAHAQAHATFKSHEAVLAGRVVQPKDELTEIQMRFQGKLARYNPYLGRVSGNFFGMCPGKADHIHECNFSARTQALKAVGGFNQEFRGNAYFEGADLALRLIEKGYDIVYRPEVSLIHLQEGSGGNRLMDKARHTYWYVRNLSLLNSLHMKKWALPLYYGWSFFYILLKMMKNMNVLIFTYGFKGWIDGMRYSWPGSRRLLLGDPVLKEENKKAI